MTTYQHFEQAYVSELAATLRDYEYRNAPRGNWSSERIGVSFQLAQPVQRHISLTVRKSNIIFNFAEALWYLAGTADLAQIKYYAPSIAAYSSDGVSLRGTAYGPRIFDYPSAGLDQWDVIRRTLAEDRDSKRAVIQIFDPRELTVLNNIDIACTLALQFVIRDDRLCGVTYMRANDAFRGIVSDVFSFTIILELLARELGVPVGSYHHMVGSLHVYDSDTDWAERVLGESVTVRNLASRDFPEMPAGDNWPHVKQVLGWEKRLRLNEMRLCAEDVKQLELPDYWQHVVGLFEIQRELRHESSVAPDSVAVLPALYQGMVAARWPGRVKLDAGVDTVHS
jgi:thymidylate synthase